MQPGMPSLLEERYNDIDNSVLRLQISRTVGSSFSLLSIIIFIRCLFSVVHSQVLLASTGLHTLPGVNLNAPQIKSNQCAPRTYRHYSSLMNEVCCVLGVFDNHLSHCACMHAQLVRVVAGGPIYLFADSLGRVVACSWLQISAASNLAWFSLSAVCVAWD